jgi:ADP-ribose pyrophosphatase
MSRPLYENPWITVREDDLQHRSGEKAKFGVVAMKPGVTVLPMDDDGTVQLVREFKYALGEESLEAVSGGIESGETPEQAGLREIGEELALVASEWVDLGLIHPFTTVVHSPNHMFLARKLRRMGRQKETQEDVQAVKMPFDEALDAVLRGQIVHGASCVLILKTHLFLTRSQGGG